VGEEKSRRRFDGKLLTAIMTIVLLTSVWAYAALTASFSDNVWQVPTMKADNYYIGASTLLADSSAVYSPEFYRDGQTIGDYIAAVAPGGSGSNITEASYIIYKDGSTYCAQNGTTGTVTTNANAATLINSVITNLGGNGGLIFIKRGSYDIDSTIHANGGIRIVGEGLNKYANQLGTKLQLTVDGIALIDVDYVANQYFFSIADIELYGNGHTTGGQTAGDITSGTFGIKLTNSFSDYLIENCFIHGFYCNIYADTNGWYGRISKCWLEASTFGGFFKHKQIIISDTNVSGNNNGLNFFGSARDIIISSCHIYQQTGYGLYIEHRSAGTFHYIIDSCHLTDAASGNIAYAYTGATINISVSNCEVGQVDYATQNYAFQSWTNGSGTLAWQIGMTKFFTVNTAYFNVVAGTGETYVFGGGNTGYITENGGFTTILNTTTSIVINHGLSYTPTTANTAWTVTYLENPTNDPGSCYVDTFTSTQATIHIFRDPGISDLDIVWSARRVP